MRSGEGHEGSTARAPKRFFRTVRWVVVSLAVAIVLLVVAAAVISRTAGFKRFATSLIADAVTRYTGRQLTIGKAPVLELGLTPALVAEEIVLSNAPWGSRREMARARKIELQVRLLPLLGGRIVIERLVIVGLDVFLETDARGVGNWEFTPAVPAAQPSTRAGPPSLLSHLKVWELLITESSFVLEQRPSGGQTRLAIERLRLSRNLITPGNLNADLAITFNGVPISLSGTMGGPDALVPGGKPFPVKVEVRTSGGRAMVEGVIGRAWEMRGVDVEVRAEVTDPAALGRALGVRLPGGGPWRVEGRIKDVEGGYAFDPMRVTGGGSTLTGGVAVDLGAERPRVVAALAAPLLDLTSLAGSAAPVTEQAAEPTGSTRTGGVFSTAPLALAGLAAADAQMSLSLDMLALREHADIGGVSVKALLADGRLTVEPIEVRTPGGTLRGSVRLDAQGGVSAELTGSGIDLGALVTILGGKAKATGGSTDVRVDLRSKGRSLREWAANLGGKVRIVVGPGRLDGEELDLGLGVMKKVVALINPFHKEDKFTELRCAVVNVSVDSGVVDLTHRIVIVTTKLSAVASGKVDLGREVLDLDVYTKAALSLSAGVSNFAGIVKVSGPLSKPSFSLAAQGAATTSLSVGAAVATGGLSLVGEDLLNKIIRRANCKDALAEPAPKPESAGRPGGS